jgi:hypothetical protein
VSDTQNELEALARAFASRQQSQISVRQCPSAEQLFAAASGDLERNEQLRIVDHASQCAECAQAWRLAMELGARPATSAAPTRRNLFHRLRWPAQGPMRASPIELRWFALAGSVVCVMGIAMYLAVPIKKQAPMYREAAHPMTPVSLVTGSLTRDRFLLRWSPGPRGSTYNLRLTTPELIPLLVEQDLARIGPWAGQRRR